MYAEIAETILPVGISGIVLAAAVAAMMSTASGALIATATVAKTDVHALLCKALRTRRRRPTDANAERDVHSDRLYVVVLGIAVIVIAALLNDVVAALTVAYDILVGGLLVADPRRLPVEARDRHRRAVVDGRRHRRHARHHVHRSATSLANEPIYYGLAASLVAYVVGSLLTPAHPGGGAAGLGRPARRARGGPANRSERLTGLKAGEPAQLVLHRQA